MHQHTLMDWMRIVHVLEICLPVFLVIGLGKLLQMRGTLNADHRQLLNKLVYYLALPALIFAEVARQRFSDLLNAQLLLPSIAAVLLIALVFTAIVIIRKYRGGVAAVVIFGTFWANVTYMGFPLSHSAFGDAVSDSGIHRHRFFLRRSIRILAQNFQAHSD